MQVWMIYLFSLVTVSIAGFVIPAANSITPRLLPDRDLQAGNSISMGTMQLMGFIGPAMAGVIIGSYTQSTQGIVLAFAFDSITFAVSALTLGMMHGVAGEGAHEPARHSGEGVWSSIKVAAGYLFRHEALRLIFIVMIVVNFLVTGPLGHSRPGRPASGGRSGCIRAADVGLRGRQPAGIFAGRRPSPADRTHAAV